MEVTTREARETAQKLRRFAAFAENLGSNRAPASDSSQLWLQSCKRFHTFC